MTTLTHPTHMSLQDWADQAVFDLEITDTFGKIDSADWPSWAVQFTDNLALGGDVPNPYMFGTWQEWAERLCEATQ